MKLLAPVSTVYGVRKVLVWSIMTGLRFLLRLPSPVLRVIAGRPVVVDGRQPVLSARVLKTGQPIQFTQDKISLRLTGLPAAAPDSPTTVLAVECDAPPVVDHHSIRPLWPRYKVGVSS